MTAAVVLGTGTAACAAFDKTFGQQTAVVQFKPQTANSTRLKVRAACAHVPAATPEPIPPQARTAQLGYDVRYEVSGASDGDLAKLQECLQRFPSVAGINFESPDGG